MRTTSMALKSSIARRSIQFSLLAASLTIVAACGKVDRLATQSSSVPFDYKERHPIVMTTKPFTVKIYPGGNKLSYADRERLEDLAKRYNVNGRGPIYVQFPSGAYRPKRALGEIRRVLAANGAKGRLLVGSYPVLDRELASPVKVSFKSLAAKVATRCGEWPDDLASATSLNSWNNKPYWNLGCAYQNMIAVQTSDPRDIASPRGEAPPDVAMRMRAIGKVRKGDDPGTKWTVKNTAIGNAGGN